MDTTGDDSCERLVGETGRGIGVFVCRCETVSKETEKEFRVDFTVKEVLRRDW